MFDIKERDVPELHVVTERRTVTQAELEAWLPGAMGRVLAAARAQGGEGQSSAMPWLARDGHPEAAVFIVLYEGNPTEGPTEVAVCVPVGDAAGATRTLPAHREAFVRLKKAQTQPTSQVGKAFETVGGWVGEQGLQIVAAPREVYYTDYFAAPPEADVFDVAFPIDRRG